MALTLKFLNFTFFFNACIDFRKKDFVLNALCEKGKIEMLIVTSHASKFDLIVLCTVEKVKNFKFHAPEKSFV